MGNEVPAGWPSAQGISVLGRLATPGRGGPSAGEQTSFAPLVDPLSPQPRVWSCQIQTADILMKAAACTKAASKLPHTPLLLKYSYITTVGPGAEHILPCCWSTLFLTGPRPYL